MLRLLLLFVVSTLIAGCELAGDIFQAGLVIGIIGVVLVIAVIGWLFRKLHGRRG